MKGKTHVLFGSMLGSIAAVATYKYTNIGDPIMIGTSILAGTGLGALLPDIDAEGATITRKVGVVGDAIAKDLKHRGITHTLLATFMLGLFVCGFSSILMAENTSKVFVSIITSATMFYIFSIFYRKVMLIRRIGKKITGLNNKSTKFILSVLIIIATYTLASYYYIFVPVFGLSLVLGYLSHLISDCFNVSGCQLLYPISTKKFTFADFRTGEHDNIFLMYSSIVTMIILALLIIVF